MAAESIAAFAVSTSVGKRTGLVFVAPGRFAFRETLRAGFIVVNGARVFSPRRIAAHPVHPKPK